MLDELAANWTARSELANHDQKPTGGIVRRLPETPSLSPLLVDPDCRAGVWDDATAQAASETGLADFPETCPWQASAVLSSNGLPE